VQRRLPLLGALAISLGFVVIIGSWWAAHGRTYVDEQFPALVAGGVFGLGLVVLGAFALAVVVHQQSTDRLAAHLTELLGPPDVSSAAPESGATGAAEKPEPDEPLLGVFDQDLPMPAVLEPAARPVAKLHEPAPVNGANGHGNGHPSVAHVVPRRTLFHDPACRLVSSREGTEIVERADAVAAGLAACRVCRP
jgi:hypothetical protein